MKNRGRRKSRRKWQYDPVDQALVDAGVYGKWSGRVRFGKTVFHSSGGHYTFVGVEITNTETGASHTASEKGQFTKSEARERAYKLARDLIKSKKL